MTHTICFPFIGSSVGGAHLSALSLIRHLDRRRFAPLIVLHEEGLLAEHLKGENIEYVHLSLPGYAGTMPSLTHIAASAWRALPILRRFLRQRGVRLVHANDLRVNLTWLAATRLAGAKFVWHQRTQTNSASPLWRLVPYMSNHCLAISQTAARPFGGPGRHLAVVDNPFDGQQHDREACRLALLREIGAAADDRLLGFIGRLVPAKRPDVALSALSILRQRGNLSRRLLVFGHGTEAMQARLAEQARTLGIAEHVHFLGFRYPIEPALAGLDLLLVPSAQEGFGRTLIEAMLVGTPVIASSIAAHQESIQSGETGVLVQSGDPQAFAAQAHRLLDDEFLWDRIATSARAYASARFSVTRHASEVQALYELLLER